MLACIAFFAVIIIIIITTTTTTITSPCCCIHARRKLFAKGAAPPPPPAAAPDGSAGEGVLTTEQLAEAVAAKQKAAALEIATLEAKVWTLLHAMLDARYDPSTMIRPLVPNAKYGDAIPASQCCASWLCCGQVHTCKHNHLHLGSSYSQGLSCWLCDCARACAGVQDVRAAQHHHF
jgi:hypothetical protein